MSPHRTYLLLLYACTLVRSQYTVPTPAIVPIVVETIRPPPMNDGIALKDQLTSWNNMACGTRGVCKNTNEIHECTSHMFRCTPCRCDPDCGRYKDCCPDADHWPVQIKDSKEFEDTVLVTYTCVSQAFKTGVTIKYAWYEMVATCPVVGGIEERRLICEHPDENDLLNNRPVFSTSSKQSYRNLHCALCNGEIEGDRLIPWKINITCNGYVDYSRISNQADFYREALHTDHCGINMMPPLPSVARECPGWANDVILQCNVTGMYSEFSLREYRLLEKACATFKQAIRIDTFTKFWAPLRSFGNVFCAACNGIRVERYTFSDPPCLTKAGYRPLYTAPLSVLFNFNPKSLEDDLIPDVSEGDCQDNMIYDTKHEACRPLVCPYGMYAKNHACFSVMTSAFGQGYRLYVNLEPTDPMNIEAQYVETLASYFMRDQGILGEQLSAIRPSMKLKVYYSFNPLANQRNLTKMIFYYSFIINREIPREGAEEILLNYMKRNWYYYLTEKTAFLEFQKTAIPFDDGLGNLAIDEPDVINLLSPYAVLITQTFNQMDHSSGLRLVYTTNSTLYTAVNELMQCPAIVLNTTEYLREGSNIFVHALNLTLGPLQYNIHGTRVSICSQFSATYKDISYIRSSKIITSLDTNEGYIQTVLSIVCTAVSCLGLLITLIVYAAIPSLRTLPGKCNMMLFLTILIAQLVFQGGVKANVSHTGCVAIGILIHYFWLAVFAWKWVCAFHMFRTFTNLFNFVQKSKTLTLYCIIAHASPALVVLVYIVLHTTLTNGHATGYGAHGLCFISNPLYIGIAFAAPVGLIIISNLCFFAKIVSNFLHKSDVAKSNHRSYLQDTVILVKMSLLLGFTWAVGFVAAATQLSVFWYIFIILNASPGVFVFFAFVLNKRVMSKLGITNTNTEIQTPFTTTMQTTLANNHGVAAAQLPTVSCNIYDTMERDHVKEDAM